MYVLKKNNIIKVNINLDKDELKNIIEIMEEKRKLTNDNDIIYSKLISLITEILEYGFVHNGKNLLEYLADFKQYNRYEHEANIYLNRKILNPKRISNNERKNIILKFPNSLIAGLYGLKIQEDLNNILECFIVEKNNEISPISQIEIHKKISDATSNSNKEALEKWKNVYFSAVRNNNLINILEIKENINKEKTIK